MLERLAIWYLGRRGYRLAQGGVALFNYSGEWFSTDGETDGEWIKPEGCRTVEIKIDEGGVGGPSQTVSK